MKDLQSLLSHASLKDASRIRLVSGQPIQAQVAGAPRTLGQPLTNQAMHGLLKSSLPPDVMALCKWGKSLQHLLDVAGQVYALQIELTADKQICIDAVPQVAASAAAPMARTVPMTEIEEGQLEAEIAALSGSENGGLIYFVNDGPRKVVEEAVAYLGYEPRATKSPQPVLEVIKFGEFSFILLCLDEHYAQDPVFVHLKMLTMDLRRQMFSVLMAPGLTTADTMQAFANSVHLVVDTQDAGELAGIIQKAKTTWQRHVATFHEFLKAEGKL